jgi:hypothetical protein
MSERSEELANLSHEPLPPRDDRDLAVLGLVSGPATCCRTDPTTGPRCPGVPTPTTRGSTCA